MWLCFVCVFLASALSVWISLDGSVQTKKVLMYQLKTRPGSSGPNSLGSEESQDREGGLMRHESFCRR